MRPQLEAAPEVAIDERRLLVRRILASPTFQKAERLRALLLYITEQTLLGNSAALTEQLIGQAVFGKPADYSPVEDSSVRANARQLRLRLHEYFDTLGREEKLILDLPKGTFIPEFRPAQSGAGRRALEPDETSSRRILWISGGIAILAVLCAVTGYIAGVTHRPFAGTSTPPWPFSDVFDPRSRTQIVVSDGNYKLLRELHGKAFTLDEYLSPGFPGPLPNPSERETRVLAQLQRTPYVSYADLLMTNRILATFGGSSQHAWVRAARDVKMRDITDGNTILVGSPFSNPWASVYSRRLDFVETRGADGRRAFVNRKPGPGEQARYAGAGPRENGGEEYAVIALVRGESRQGSVLLFHGIHQEGTEAAGLLLTGEEGRARLRSALRLPPTGTPRGVYFQALIRTLVIGGSPAATEIVAVRRAG